MSDRIKPIGQEVAKQNILFVNAYKCFIRRVCLKYMDLFCKEMSVMAGRENSKTSHVGCANRLL